MNSTRELKPDQLVWRCNPDEFDFETTESLTPADEIVGQERALKALKVGVELRSSGYNMFICGLSGTGKATTVKRLLETLRPKRPKLNDYAYVNNFQDPDRPTLLIFPAGQAARFKRDIAVMIEYLKRKIPKALESDPFISKQMKIIAEYAVKEKELMSSFQSKLEKNNFSIGQVKIGEVVHPEILPVIDNKPIAIQQLEDFVKSGKLSKDQSVEITKKYSQYQEELQGIFKKGLKLSQNFQEKIMFLEKETVSLIVEGAISSLRDKYKVEKITVYLNDLAANILDNLDVFKGTSPSSQPTDEGLIIDYFKEYEINIILDNSHTQECPVIIETTPTSINLFGLIEKLNDRQGGWYTDFTRIKSGSLLRANGGYLVLNALDAIGEPGVWKTLKRVLMYGVHEIQDYSGFFQISPSILKPEPIEINTKIILIGSSYLYYLLSDYEEDFNKIFKIKADFDYEMKRDASSVSGYARVLKNLIDSEGLMEFDKTAVAAITEYGARYAESQEKLTARFSYIADLARESNLCAKSEKSPIVYARHIHEAYLSAKERYSLLKSKYSEMIDEGTILIDTSGTRIGQVNGLALYGYDYYFGKPVRITANVALGDGSIINVEREAGLSGSTHNKGVMIISGYFRETFGQSFPLSFQASLVFEQGYGPIEGDSASAAEICAMLSTISGLPVKQGLAITGSVNQKGDIQPIGGVNEKIEGFFDVCKLKGLKDNGVIIPEQNINNLMLKDEIGQAVKEGKFHIYPVRRIEEAVELLLDKPAGDISKSGHFRSGTVYYFVERKLKEMHKKTNGTIKAAKKKKGNKK